MHSGTCSRFAEVRVDPPELITFGRFGWERLIEGIVLFIFAMGLHPGGDLALHVLFGGCWLVSES